MTPLSFTRAQLVRQGTLTETDLAEVEACRRDHNRLGFAYQIGFVRLFHRFPAQQPFEICQELLNFVALQLQLDASLGEIYAARQPTVSEHQTRIREYLGLIPFGADQMEALEKFIFAEAMRLEHAAALLSRAREFLTERHVLFPAARDVRPSNREYVPEIATGNVDDVGEGHPRNEFRGTCERRTHDSTHDGLREGQLLSHAR